MNALSSTTVGSLVQTAAQPLPVIPDPLPQSSPTSNDETCSDPVQEVAEEISAAEQYLQDQERFLEILNWLNEQNLQLQMEINDLWADFTRCTNWQDAKHNSIMGIIGISGPDLGADSLAPGEAQSQSDSDLARSIGLPTFDLTALFGIYPDT
jgi:hypothetical protein